MLVFAKLPEHQEALIRSWHLEPPDRSNPYVIFDLLYEHESADSSGCAGLDHGVAQYANAGRVDPAVCSATGAWLWIFDQVGCIDPNNALRAAFRIRDAAIGHRTYMQEFLTIGAVSSPLVRPHRTNKEVSVAGSGNRRVMFGSSQHNGSGSLDIVPVGRPLSAF